MAQSINRRAFLRHVPLAAAATALPTAAIAQAQVSSQLPDDVIEAIRDWQEAIAAKKVATAAYCGRDAPKHTLPIDHPLRAAWFDADEAAMQAQFRLLDLLEAYAA